MNIAVGRALRCKCAMTNLKARRRKQKIAKVEKVERGHGLENVELLHNHVPRDGATVEPVRHGSEVRCAVVM
jgi:hypothetical protein